VEPGPEGTCEVDRGPLARQHQEHRLRRVARAVLVAKYARTDAQHHGFVAPDEDLERFLVLASQERGHQLAVAPGVGRDHHPVSFPQRKGCALHENRRAR
jgi:hypothetical protein